MNNNLSNPHFLQFISVNNDCVKTSNKASDVKISMLLPTRNRPELLKQFLDSVVQTSKDLSEIEIVLYVDDDDQSTQELDYKELNIIRLVGPRLSMGEYNHACLYHSSGKIIILVNDDVIIETMHWDAQVKDTAKINEDEIYLAYPSDTIMVKDCSFPILSRKTCNLLIQPFPFVYKRLFIDIHLMDIFKRLSYAGENRIYNLENIVFKHLRNELIKTDNYEKQYHSRNDLRDDIAYFSLRNMRDDQSQRLYAVINNKELPDIKMKEDIPSFSRYLIPVLWSYVVGFLFDNKLPLSRRFSFFYWFSGHYIMTNTWLCLFRKEKINAQ